MDAFYGSMKSEISEKYSHWNADMDFSNDTLDVNASEISCIKVCAAFTFMVYHHLYVHCLSPPLRSWFIATFTLFGSPCIGTVAKMSVNTRLCLKLANETFEANIKQANINTSMFWWYY